MNYKDTIKRQSVIIAASIAVMALILIGSSYALFSNKASSTNAQVVTSGTLVVDYTGSAGVTNTGDSSGNVLPTTQGETSAYDIKVKNTGNLGMDYKLLIYTGTTNTVSADAIKVQVDSEEAVTLSSLTKVDATQTGNDARYILTTSSIAGAQNNVEPVNTHNVKVWIDEEASESIIGETILVKVSVDGSVKES